MSDESGLSPRDLAQFISEQGVEAQLVPMDVETATVAQAAAALGVDPDQIIKTMAFSVRDQVFLVIAAGTHTVDSRVLADRFGVGKKQVKLADAETVRTATGYRAGGVPPIGHLLPLLVLIDRAVIRWSEVYGGGGDDRTLLRIAPSEIARVTHAEWLDVGRVKEG